MPLWKARVGIILLVVGVSLFVIPLVSPPLHVVVFDRVMYEDSQVVIEPQKQHVVSFQTSSIPVFEVRLEGDAIRVDVTVQFRNYSADGPGKYQLDYELSRSDVAPASYELSLVGNRRYYVNWTNTDLEESVTLLVTLKYYKRLYWWNVLGPVIYHPLFSYGYSMCMVLLIFLGGGSLIGLVLEKYLHSRKS